MRFLDKAHTRGADAIILDLEDSVPPGEKIRAREGLSEATRSVSRHGADVLVRINRPLRTALADLEAAIAAGADAIWLSKTESPEHVQLMAEVASEIEEEIGWSVGSTKFVVVIENPAAYFRANDIARANPRIVAMGLGSEDFALEAGMTPDTETLYVPKQTVQISARAAGIIPLGFIGTVADYADTATFTETVRKSRRFGFEGATCVHPSSIPILNKELAPSSDEIAKAKQIISLYGKAEKQGLGAITLDDKMIDVPIVERARRLLVRADAIVQKEFRKTEMSA